MIFVRYEKLTETKAHVIFRHYQPETLSEETLKTGILVESIPEPEYIEGKISHLYYNLQTKEFFYEYTDREKTKEEQLQEQLQSQQEQIDILALSVLELKNQDDVYITNVMYPVLERLHKKGKLTDKLWETAIKIGWITVAEKEKIINANK